MKSPLTVPDNYGLATVRYPVLEVTARTIHTPSFFNGCPRFTAFTFAIPSNL